MFEPHTSTPTRRPASRSRNGPSRAAVAAAPAGSSASFSVVEGQPHGLDHGRILDPHDLVDEAAAQAEAVGQRVGRAQAVGDGGDPLDLLRAAGGKAAPHAVGAHRLDAEDQAVRAAAA